MRITVEEARAFFLHPSQGVKPDALPTDGVEYWADGPVCGVFHDVPWPGVISVHCGVKPEGWGKLDAHARNILISAWDFYQPKLIVAWSDARNRAVLAFNKRIGFKVHGEMPVEGGVVVMQHWTKAGTSVESTG